MNRTSASRKDSQLSAVVTTVVIVGTLYLAKVVFIPLALALLLSFLLTPVVAILERIKLPRGLAIFVVLASLCAVIGLLGWKTFPQFVDLTSQVPTYKTQLLDKIHALKGQRSQNLAKVSETVKDLESAISTGSGDTVTRSKASPPGSSESHPIAVEVVPPANPLGSFQSMLGPMATAGIILVFTIFMLLGREDLRDRFIRVAGGGRLTAMTQALDEASRRINRYLLLQMLVNAGYGVLIGTGLYFIGIPNASLWGVAATLLRFLPYAGPPMAAAMPIFLSLAIFNDWRHALETAGLFFILEVIVSNFLEPLLYSAHVGLSALAILVAAIFWTLIWGIPGLLLSTPLTVFLVVMGRYIPSLAFLNVLLGDEPVLPPHEQFYQRLLASEHEEARHVLDAYLKEKTQAELYSDVVIPALSMAEQDRYRGELDDDSQAMIYRCIRDLIEDLGESSSPQSSQESRAHTGYPTVRTDSDSNRTEIICVPSRDEADDVVAFMLAQLLEGLGFRAQSVPMGPVSEMLVRVSGATPRIVCISALPPFAISHARDLYRKLRRLVPEIRIVICLWHLGGDLQSTSVRLKLAAGDLLSSTLPETLDYVNSHLTTKAQALVSHSPPIGR